MMFTKMLLPTVLSMLTLASAATCPFNPTNPNSCPIWIQSTATEARFDLNYAFSVGPSGGEPLIALAQNINVYFQYDGNLAIYGHTTIWSTTIPAHDCTRSICRLNWQTDGNLVIYIDGVALWQAGTGGIGKQLTFTSKSYAIEITGAGGPGSAPLFNTPVTENAVLGDTSASVPCSGYACTRWMCSGCIECWPAVQRCVA